MNNPQFVFQRVKFLTKKIKSFHPKFSVGILLAFRQLFYSLANYFQLKITNLFLFDQNIQNDRNNSKVSYAAMLKKGIENKSAKVGFFFIFLSKG